MTEFQSITLQTLRDQLGTPHAKGMSPRGNSRYSFNLTWNCVISGGIGCFAYTSGPALAMPSGLTSFEQEMFEHAPLPEDGWTLRPCPAHALMFADFSEQSE